MANGLYGSLKSRGNKVPEFNYNMNTGDMVLGGNLQNPTGFNSTPVGLYNQNLSNSLAYSNPTQLNLQGKQSLYGVNLNDVANMPTYSSNGSIQGLDNTGLLGSIWQGAKDFGSYITKPLTGTEMNPGKSILDYGLSGLSGLSSLYGAYKQGEYTDKMAKLADRQQGLYESQIANQDRRRDLAQSNYNASFK